jgi:hypothetical protein
MIQKYIFVVILLIIVILLSLYFENSYIAEPYKPYRADYSKDFVNPPPKNSNAIMPDPGTFKLMDVTSSTYFDFDRSQNIAVMNPDDGVQLYIDVSSNIIYNKNSGAVGLVDYINDNYIDNVEGRIEVSDKILNTPTASYTIDGPKYGNIKGSWIFCLTSTPFVYNIYNSGGWLSVVRDSEHQARPYITKTRHDWLIIGDAQQVNDCAVTDYFSIQDPITQQYLFVDPHTSSCKLNDQPSNFVINDAIQSVFHTKYGTNVFQDMLNGYCIVPSDNSIISERFVLDNPKLGWRLFKTNQADHFIIYNNNANGWLYTNGNSISLKDTPVSWTLSGPALKYFKTEQPPFFIQDDLTKKYIFIDSYTDTPVLSDKATYFTSHFINGKNDQSGIYIVDIANNNYLINIDNALLSTQFNSQSKDLFFWSFVPVNGSQYHIFKITGSTKKNDTTNALYVDYNAEGNRLTVLANGSGTYRVWNLIYPNNTKMNEPFVGSIQEGLSAPLGPVGAMNAAMSGAQGNPTNQSNMSMMSQIPSPPEMASPELTDKMESIPGMDPSLISSVKGMNLPNINGADMATNMQSTITNTFQAIQTQFAPNSNNLPKTVLNKNADLNNPLRLFKTPHQLNISSRNDGKSNWEETSQYINAMNNGNITDGSGKAMGHPLGNRYFVDTNTNCKKKDGNGMTERYILVDNMKYMKYEDGTVNNDNYGLLYSAMGSLQEIDSNNLLSQLGQIENPDDPNNKCINVTIDMKGDQKTFESKFITLGDCKKIDAIAFKGQNAKVCEAFSGGHDGHNEHGRHGEHSHHSEHSEHSRHSEYSDNGYKIGKGLSIDNIYLNDTNRDLVWIPEDFVPRAVVVDDSITTFYLASLTVIGLFILYRLMEKN